MYIIIVGGGKVGFYLAKELLNAEHEVLIIERDSKRVSILNDEFGTNIIAGDGCEVKIMEDAGIARADAIIAVTGDDEDNLVVCQIARHKYNVPRTIARINNPKNEKIFHRLGIDVTVSSTELILAHIEEMIPAKSLIHLLSLRNLGVNFVELTVPSGSPVLGKPLRLLGIPKDCVLSLIVRNEKESIIPFGETQMEVGDQVIAVTTPTGEETFRCIIFGK